MKRIGILVVLFFAFGCAQSVESLTEKESIETVSQSNRGMVETLEFNFDEIGIAGQITLSDPPEGDPGEFQAISIHLKSGTEFQYKNPEAWNHLPENLQGLINNELRSERVWAVRNIDELYLLIFGYPYSCCPQRVTIISLQKESISTIFDEEFVLESIEDLDGNGTIDLIGRKQLNQIGRVTDSAEISPYTPFLVYSLSEKFELQGSLTKSYNEAAYVFAGFEYSEEIEVALPKKGFDFKPFILSSALAK